MEERSALVVGTTGIVGGNLCERLLAKGWTIYALARRPEADVFRWRSLWPRRGKFFGLDPADYSGKQQSLQALMADAGPNWRNIAARYDLREPDIGRLATWWHTDADLGRVVECISDMARSRKGGFLNYQSSTDTYLDLFRRLQQERIIPAYQA